MHSKWKSVAAFCLYSLGISYYFAQWLIAAGLAGSIIPFFLQNRILWITIVSGLSLISLIAGVAAWLFKSRRQLEVLNPSVCVLASTDTYRIISPYKCSYEKQVKIRALYSGVDSWRTKFRWTGGDSVKLSVEPPPPTCSVQQERSPDGVWDIARVQLSRQLIKKEEISFTLKFDLENHARPFLQKLVDDFYPNGLTMSVILPSIPKQVTKEIFLSARSELPIWTDYSTPVSESRTIEWKIKWPSMGRRYKITWELQEGTIN